jgi:hypothetical protein
MKIRGVDFPPAVISAQRDGQLVIFAGAGTSMDPPSNYPDFDALAAQVGGGTHPRMPGEAIDRYLGRLVNNGITVHEQVRTILSSPTSLPNAVHRALVGLFKNTQQFRIVTTNFDRHLTSAATEHFSSYAPELFYAPALPVGSDFTGLIYLHGSVDRPAHSLVLTDADFGRAYITDGWATRFLERLFARFFVLFVGYSHQDMLLTYLARGLTAGSSGPGRFAFTLPGDDARWNNLGITPIHYPAAEIPERKHGELRVVLTAWAEQSQAGALAVEERIRSIVTSESTLTADDEDFLTSAMSEPATLRFFTRHARHIKWLNWIESKQEFRRLFRHLAEYSEADAELAGWFAEQHALVHIDAAFDVLRRSQTHLSFILSGAISSALLRHKTHGEILSKWLALLLNTGVPSAHHDIIEYVLSHCEFPDDVNSALSLFDYLTSPRVHLKESLRWPADGSEPSTATDVEVSCIGSDYWLQHSWSSLFVPHLDCFAKALQPIVTAHLVAARRVLLSYGRANSKWDPLSFSRGMIESREQDHLHDGVSSLIDAGAALLTWGCEHDPEWADALVVQWYEAESPLLRRLAIYGMTISATHVADDKLHWVAENELLYRFGFKHEVFLLLRAAYPHASESARGELLRQAALQHKPSSEDQETADYEFFNLVAWLADSAPDCKLAAATLLELEKNNPRFGRRVHPDMDSWIGPVSHGGLDAPAATVDLESMDAQQLVERLEAGASADCEDHGYRGTLARAITQKAQSSHEWGLTIARQAQQQSIWSTDLWLSIISAWQASDLTYEEWSTVLDILGSAEATYDNTASGIASLLERGARNPTSPIPATLIERSKSLADAMWDRSETVSTSLDGDQIDWLGKAINHPAGELIEFYLTSMGVLEREKLMTNQLRHAFEHTLTRAIQGVSPGAQLGRVIIASQAHFLFAVDQQWTRSSVLPLLDPSTDELRASQCWHGYLYWGRWNDSMLVDLLPSYEAMFVIIDREKPEMQRTFCSHLAGIAVYGSVHPLEHGWVSRFIATVTPKIRELWAGELRAVMGSLDDSAKLHLWNRWLKKYWEERLQGRPAALTRAEAAEMYEWLLHLGPVVPEVVNLVTASPYPDLGRSMAYYHIAKSPLLKEHPDAFAALLVFLTAGERGRPIYDLSQLYEAVEQLGALIPEAPQLRNLCDELARLGAAGVATLAAKLKPPYMPQSGPVPNGNS